MLFQYWNILFLAIIFLLTVSSFCDSVYNFGGNIVLPAIFRAPTNQSSILTILSQ